MLDGNNKSLSANDTDSEIVPHIRDPGLLKSFAALEEDLRMIVGQIGRYHDPRLDQQ
jgi:hypothetical protein